MSLRDCDVLCPHCGSKMVVLRDRVLCGCPQSHAPVVPTSGNPEIVEDGAKSVPGLGLGNRGAGPVPRVGSEFYPCPRPSEA